MQSQNIDHYILKTIIWENKLYFLLLLIIGIAFYVFNVQTPFSHDDYAYCFYYDVDSYVLRPTNIRINNVFQMFESMWHHYQCVNGRFVSHIILQCFCAFWGKSIFNICNTFVFIIFLHLIVSLSGRRYSILILLITFIVSMCIMPYPGQTMLWMTGSINYLWTATLTLAYLYWMKQYIKKSTSFFCHVFAATLCFLIGWTHESITLPVAFGLFLYFVFNRNHFHGLIISSYFGYSLGVAMVVFAPGTFFRLFSSGEINTQVNLIQFVFSHAYNLFMGYFHTILPLFVLVIYIVLYFRYIRKASCYIIHNYYALLFISFSIFFYVLGMDEDRVFLGISILSLLILYKHFSHLFLLLEKKYYVIVLLLLLSVIPVRIAYLSTKEYSDYNEVICNEIIRSPSKCVVISHPCDIKSRYTYVTLLDKDIHSFHNRVKAFYYDKEYIQALPHKLYEALQNASFRLQIKVTEREVDGKKVYEFDDFWLLLISEMPKARVYAKYIFEEDLNSLSLKHKVIRYLLNTLHTKEKIFNCYPLEYGNEIFLVIPKFVNSLSIHLL